MLVVVLMLIGLATGLFVAIYRTLLATLPLHGTSEPLLPGVP